MSLESYLLNQYLEEQNTIEELLYIDNQVQGTNNTFQSIGESLKRVSFSVDTLDTYYDAITDGEVDSVYKLLISYAPYIKNISIDRSFVGLNKWLIERTKEYYEQQDIHIPLSLDLTRDYSIYQAHSQNILLCGFPEFIEGMEDLFFNQNIKKVEK